MIGAKGSIINEISRKTAAVISVIDEDQNNGRMMTSSLTYNPTTHRLIVVRTYSLCRLITPCQSSYIIIMTYNPTTHRLIVVRMYPLCHLITPNPLILSSYINITYNPTTHRLIVVRMYPLCHLITPNPLILSSYINITYNPTTHRLIVVRVSDKALCPHALSSFISFSLSLPSCITNNDNNR